ncbi:glutathione S-transferase [Mycena sp. CBHHK59/15]|nr:glutathione S-transferase [Mycena sp. CBHHK59/15]
MSSAPILKVSASPTITVHLLENSRAQPILWLLEGVQVPYKIKSYKREKTMLAPPELKTVHPLGKSPVITVGDRVIAESGLIVEYISEHFGTILIPSKWKDGCEGKVGGETEEYMRYRYYMYYCEGSLMALLLVAFIDQSIKNSPVPFFIRFITTKITAQMNKGYLDGGFKTHFGFLEEQLASAPNGGPYLCGDKLTGADIMMGYTLVLAKGRSPLAKEEYPKLWAYVELLKESASYKRSVDKIVEVFGEYKEF